MTWAPGLVLKSEIKVTQGAGDGDFSDGAQLMKAACLFF